MELLSNVSDNMSNSSTVNYRIDATTDRQHTLGNLTVINDTSYNVTGSTYTYYDYEYYNTTLFYDYFGFNVAINDTYVLPLNTKLIFGYLQLILVIVGLIGNILSITVLTRPKNRNSSTATYLTALAFSDIVILLSQSMTGVLLMYITNNVELWCKFIMWIRVASLTTSSWLLIAVTIERTLSVTFPYHVKRLCTPNIAKIVVVAIWCTMYVLHCHFLFGFEIFESYGENVCFPKNEDYAHFMATVNPWIDITMVFGIPCLCILSGNIIIIVKMWINLKKRQNMTTLQKRRTETSLTVTLVVVNIIFILTMSPATIFKIIVYDFDLTSETYIFVYLVLNIVSNVNAAANFFLYVLSGAKFRADVKILLKSVASKLNVLNK